MTDKKTIELIEAMSRKVDLLQADNIRNSLKITFVLWIMGAILLAILPAFGFLIAFWVESSHG